MSFKSIIDIDINDEKFKSFLESFQRYTEEAEKAPEDWHKVAKAITGAEKRVKGFGHSQGKAFKDTRDQAHAAGKSLRGYTGAARAASVSTRRLDSSLGKTNRSQKSFIESVRHGSKGLKGFSVDAAASALGLDELAGPLGLVAAGVTAVAVGAAKAALSLDKLTASKVKNAKAMGVTVAQQQAFNNYGSQLVSNPDAALAAVYRAKMNPQYAGAFLRAGMTHQQLESESAPEALFTYIKDIRAKLKAQPADFRGAMWHSLGADEVLGGTEGMGLVLNNSLKHINSYQARYKKHEAAYAISRAHGYNSIKASQAVSELKGKITTDLENAAASKPATAMIMGTIRAGRTVANDVDASGSLFASRIEKAGAAFAADLYNILHGKSHSLAPVGSTAARLLLPHDKLAKQGYVQTLNGVSPGLGTWWQKHVAQTLTNPGAWGVALKNPGNVERLNAKMLHGEKKFMKYGSWGQGYRAMANTLRSYPARGFGDTIFSMAQHYNPISKTNTLSDEARYIGEISEWSGLGENQKLNLNNPSILSRLVAAQSRAENGIKISPQNVEKAWGPHYLALLEQIAHNTAQHHIHVHTNTGKVSVAAHAAAR